MEKFYKKGAAVYQVAYVHEWKGRKAFVCNVAKDSDFAPLSIDVIYSDVTLEVATADEWDAALAKAMKCQAKIDKAQREREEAEEFGVRVIRRTRRHGHMVGAEDDFIVRATKTQWIGVHGRYKRNGKWERGEPVSKPSYRFAPVTYITEESLDTLDHLAAGRERVNFVKERKQIEVAK